MHERVRGVTPEDYGRAVDNTVFRKVLTFNEVTGSAKPNEEGEPCARSSPNTPDWKVRRLTGSPHLRWRS